MFNLTKQLTFKNSPEDSGFGASIFKPNETLAKILYHNVDLEGGAIGASLVLCTSKGTTVRHLPVTIDINPYTQSDLAIDDLFQELSVKAKTFISDMPLLDGTVKDYINLK